MAQGTHFVPPNDAPAWAAQLISDLNAKVNQLLKQIADLQDRVNLLERR